MATLLDLLIGNTLESREDTVPGDAPDEFVSGSNIVTGKPTKQRLLEQMQQTDQALAKSEQLLQEAQARVKGRMVSSLIPRLDPNPILNQAKEEAAEAAIPIRTKTPLFAETGEEAAGPVSEGVPQRDPLSLINDLQSGILSAQSRGDEGEVERLLNQVGQVVLPGSAPSSGGDTFLRFLLGRDADLLLGPSASRTGQAFLGGGKEKEQTAEISRRGRQLTGPELDRINQNQRLQLELQAIGEERKIPGTPEQVAAQLPARELKQIFDQSIAPLATTLPGGSQEFKKLSIETQRAATGLIKDLQDVQTGQIDVKKAQATWNQFQQNAQLDLKKKQAEIDNFTSQVESRKTGASAKQRELDLQKARADLAEMKSGVFSIVGEAMKQGLIKEEDVPELMSLLLSMAAPSLNVGAAVEQQEGIIDSIRTLFGFEPRERLKIGPRGQAPQPTPDSEQERLMREYN